MDLIDLLKEKLNSSSEFRRLSSNLGWLFSEKFLRYLIGIVISIWVARYLGPEKYGVLNYCIAFMTFFTGLATLGLPQILIRELVNNPDRSGQLLATSIVMLLISSIIALLVGILLLWVIRPKDNLTLLLGVIVGTKLILNSSRVFSCYFESRVEAKYNVLANTYSYILIGVLKIIAILVSANIYVFGILFSLETFFISIWLIFFYLKNQKQREKWCFDLQLAKTLISDSYPLIFSVAVVALHLRIDQIMVRDFASDNEAGLYAVAVRLTELWYFIPVIIQSTFFPRIIKSMKKGKNVINRRLYQLFSIMVLTTLIIAIPTSILSNSIVEFLYGKGFEGAGTLLSLLIWALLFVSLGVVRNAFLYSKNFTKIHFQVVLIGLVINVIGNYYLIPILGAYGAAIVTIISYSVASFFANFLFKELRELAFLMLKAMYSPNVF